MPKRRVLHLLECWPIEQRCLQAALLHRELLLLWLQPLLLPMLQKPQKQRGSKQENDRGERKDAT